MPRGKRFRRPKCPECGGKMERFEDPSRDAFYGCRSFPSCRGRLSVDDSGRPVARRGSGVIAALTRRKLGRELDRIADELTSDGLSAPQARATVRSWLNATSKKRRAKLADMDVTTCERISAAAAVLEVGALAERSRRRLAAMIRGSALTP